MNATISTETNTNCAATQAIEALRDSSALLTIMGLTAERASEYVARHQPGEDMRLGVIFETRTSGGWIITDWHVEEGVTPGEDVTTVKLQVVYRPSAEDLRYGYKILHQQFPEITEEAIARAATTMCSEHVMQHSASVEILLDDLFLDALSEHIGVPREVLELSFCVEAEFASAVITEREVSEFMQEEFARVAADLHIKGLTE